MEPSLPPAATDYGKFVEVADVSLIFRRVPVPDSTPTARQVLAVLGFAPHSEYVVLQWLPSGDIEEVRSEEQVDMTGVAAPKLIIEPSDRTFRFSLNDRSLVWPVARIEEKALRTLGAIDAAQQIFLERQDDVDLELGAGAHFNLKQAGTEVFYSKSNEWKLNVQGVVVKSERPTITVRDALAKAGFDIETAWIIVLKTASERKQVNFDYVVDLREPGIEKLRLTPPEINNGEVATIIRHDFALLTSDEAWLASRRYDWSTIVEGGRRWLLLRDAQIPSGFNVAVADVAVEVPTSYPMAEIDMFYCYPPLVRNDGQVIPQTQVSQIITGRSFQRWSRHRGAAAPWRPGKDNVVTHMLLVEESLAREVGQ